MPGARQRQSDSATHPFPAFERRPADPASKAANPPPPPASPTRRALLPPPLLPWQRVRRALCPDPQAYMNGLGTLGPTARPSALQPLHGNSCGPRAPSSLCRPVLAPCGTRLTGLPTGRAGQLLPTAAAQCYLSLGTVKGLPHSGGCRSSEPPVAASRLCHPAAMHGEARASHLSGERRCGRGSLSYCSSMLPSLLADPAVQAWRSAGRAATWCASVCTTDAASTAMCRQAWRPTH